MPEVVVHEGEVLIHSPQQFYAGDTWIIEALCTNADGTPMDLTGATVEWKLVDPLGVAMGVTLASNTSGVVITSPTLGQAKITLTKDQSATLVPGYYKEQL